MQYCTLLCGVIKMKELKQMIVDDLLIEYPLDEAIKDVDEAEIRIKGNNIQVIWSNGAIGNYKIEMVEKLILVL